MATDREIIEAAVSRGAADAQVCRQVVSERSAFNNDDGEWFGLFVRERGGSDWRIVIRRRTRGELLAMVEARNAVEAI